MASPLIADSTVRILDLRQIHGRDLEPLLEDEIRTWEQSLDWSFSASAELVLRFVNMQSLNGYALTIDGRMEGYTYYITEDHKGMIGDIYLREPYRVPEFENLLLESSLAALMADRDIHRVETQLMMLSNPLRRKMPLPRWLQVFPRTFMVKPLDGEALPPSTAESYVQMAPWREHGQEEAARLITECYRGHIDSRINDQYQTLPGARKFLLNIIQYPGCGRFFAPASFFCSRRDNGAVCGMILSSIVGPTTGHITQLCVSPAARGYGIGYELLRHCLAELAAYGCRQVSLTVTSSNVSAIRLYERAGFTAQREFAAHVWEGF